MTSNSNNNSSVAERAPRLSSSTGSGGGTTYAIWRPQFMTFLMRHNIEERDYIQPIPSWKAIVASVQISAEAEEQNAIAIVLASSSSSSSSSKSVSHIMDPDVVVKKEPSLTRDQLDAKKKVAEMISRSKKAYGFLFGALPNDHRQLVADVPQGYAYGIWNFLEKKYRNTEQDSVLALWEQFTALKPEEEETFDVYKARVDSVVELLQHAKQTIPQALYASIMLWRLQARYATAVLTLKAGDRLKDSDNIDWTYIIEYMAQYERSQHGLGEGETSERAMVVRNKTALPSNNSGSKNDLSGIKCFNCNKFGHYRSSCSKPDKRKNKNKNSSAAAAAIGDDEDSDEGESAQEGARQQANAARAVSSSQVTSGRTYCAVARLGVALVAAAAASSSKSTAVKQPLKRLVRPGESRRPPAAASSSSSSAAAVASPKIVEPRIASSKSLDHALRTTARAVDTGATVPLTPNKDSLINVRKCMPMPILMADGTVVSATYKGDMPMRLPVAGEQDKKVKIVIKDVYFHERFHMNLLSWDCMRKEGCVEFAQ